MIQKLFLSLVDFYQRFIRIFYKRQVCVFYPSCSEYTKEAIQKYGPFKGVYMGIKRIVRCHPWQKNHMDPLK